MSSNESTGMISKEEKVWVRSYASYLSDLLRILDDFGIDVEANAFARFAYAFSSKYVSPYA